MRTSHDLADGLVGFVVGQLEALADRHAPDLALPRVFAGHAVGPDARADLAFTLGLLAEAGVEQVAGCGSRSVALATLRTLDGEATDTFYSYRAAETVARLGGLRDNPALVDWSEADLADLALAVDSTAVADEIRRGERPPNYAVVLARCEVARERLGLLDDSSILDEFVERARAMLATGGWFDDSHDGSGQYDIYTPDVYLFAEPLADRLGEVWTDGLRRVLGDIDYLVLPGGAIVWGRSIGALGLAMTVELAAVGAGRELVAQPDVWAARARRALDDLGGWFADGVIRAHQYRSTMFYRGPERRLQMTLDVLGKLAQAALELRRGPVVEIAPPGEAWSAVDRLVSFDDDSHAGAWAHRDHRLPFVMPFVSGWSTDYIAAPRSPGLFESPVESLACFVPVVRRDGVPGFPVGRPVSVTHESDSVVVEHDGFGSVPGHRRATYRVEGRSLSVEEQVTIDLDPADVDSVSLQIPELGDRPLDVTFGSDVPNRATTIDVSGMKEWRSFWHEFSQVHQIDLEPAGEIELRWSVTPRLRVGSTALQHDYHRSLYDAMAGRVVEVDAMLIQDSVSALRGMDLLHVDWPEWFTGPDPDRAHLILANLRDAGVRIVWTMHNLLPHAFKQAREVYELWAAAADGVIHHSEWGRQLALATYDYGPDTLHLTLPHGHWGHRFKGSERAERAAVEKELGLPPCELRLAIVGAARAEKDVQLVVDAFHACDRSDLQLVVGQRGDAVVPDDPRIADMTGDMLPEGEYQRQFAAFDVIVLPFASEGMLTTGTIGDVIGAGKASLISDWPYLHEALGDAAIHYGSSRKDLTEVLAGLGVDEVRASAEAAVAMQRDYEWGPIAQRTLALLDEVASMP